MTTFHLKLNIAEFMRQSRFPEDYRNMFDDDRGLPMTPKEAYEYLTSQLIKGHRYIPCSSECEGFDPIDKGCPGHPQQNSSQKIAEAIPPASGVQS